MTKKTERWSKEKIKKLWKDLAKAIDHNLKDDLSRQFFGFALWSIFSNNNTVVDKAGHRLEAGSFRGAGALISEVCGGDYMTYYMSNDLASRKTVAKITKELKKRGFSVLDWDAWELGCKKGKYKTPEWMKDLKEIRVRGARFA